MALSRPTALRGAAHLVTWLPFIYGAASSVWNGWRPVSDVAGIALRSWNVLYLNGPQVGQATRLARGVYDLGPLQYWLLTVPVHLDPMHGVLWGAALWCMVACSLTIEAAWSVSGQFGGLVAAAAILGVILWIPAIATLPCWNPWFGMMYFLASFAAAWAVIAGNRRWWPVLMVTASIAAQAHLMFAVAAAALVFVALVVGLADTFRARASYRWALIGLLAGLACWIAPLIQQFTAPTGNLTNLIDSQGTAGPTGGLTFGLKAVAASVQPPPVWWSPLSSLPGLSVVHGRSAAFGVAVLVVTAAALAVAIRPLGSRWAAALAGISLLASVTAVISYSSLPVSNITSINTEVNSLNYLMAPMYPVGVLTWLTLGSVLVLIGRRVISRVRARAAVPAEGGGGPVAEPAIPAARWAVPTTTFAVVLVIALISMAGIKSGQGSSSSEANTPYVRAINVASQKIERKLPGQPIQLSVVAADIHFRRKVTFGLAYALTTAGYRPQVASSYAWQLGSGYGIHSTNIPTVTVFQNGGDTSVYVTKPR
jgi:hypothetical protein